MEGLIFGILRYFQLYYQCFICDENILLLQLLPETEEKISLSLTGATPETIPEKIAALISAPVPSHFKSGDFAVYYTTNMTTKSEQQQDL